MPDLPALNAESYLGDGLYVSFDEHSVRLRAPRVAGEHIVYLEQPVYRELMCWIASYPVLWEHFATDGGRQK